MTDRDIALGLEHVQAIEREARAELAKRDNAAEDRRHAEIVTRQAIGLRRALEKWVVSRTCRAVAR